MKLLLDQNLSRKIVSQINDLYPESCHLTTVLPETALDQEIWEFAKGNDFVIVTKDDDFEQRSVLLGHPPKVLWIRLGNCKTEDITELLIRLSPIIEAFGKDTEKALLPIP